METKFKDVAHLYLGCELDTDCHGQGIQGHMPISFKELDADNLATILYQLSNDDWGHYCKPILRPLSDMSEEELIELLTNVYESIYGIAHEPFKDVILHAEGNDKVGLVCKCYMGQRIGFSIEVERGVDISSDGLHLMVNQFDCTKWLLSKHFDLFGLIENGEALDKTKL